MTESASGGTPIVSVKDLSRSYGQVVALNDVSLDIHRGVIGLLGPNGAGKSTLLRIMTGELRPGLGTVSVLGMQPFANAELYHRIGVCPEQDALFEDMTGREFIAFVMRLRGWKPEISHDRADEWLERVGLTEARNRKLRGYSKGMRQRVKLCTAFVHEPDVLFLDEPLTGLDPLWRHRIQEAVRERAAAGATVIFSSHVLHEVEQVTREVVLLHRGRVAAQGDARQIRAMIDRFPHRIYLTVEDSRRLATHLMGWESVESVRVRDGGLDVTSPKPNLFYDRLTAECADSNLGVTGMTSPDDSIQALFETLVNARPAKGGESVAGRRRAART